ncbi:MAG: peptidoglycan DD-metalloendopeptidase family protein [Candidatus Sungbacteria bacterium]|uniref:Peptidoglycan DD-metalloendopeptidase family protein n=1 Tax=Candidatus Sungiibacteriota bacterium TaxID=2750080 RepID=A0A932YYG1_9BACT|nr:peptidoglycan DD-metalloendopeptidase family protein [Candidatus Sungbacteria bacterium]
MKGSFSSIVLSALLPLGALLFVASFAEPLKSEAQTLGPAENGGGDIRDQIDDKNQEIKRLEAEAAKHRAALDEIGRAADTLASQVAAYERAIKKLDTDIRLTSAKISRTNLEIRELAAGIREKETSIEAQRERLGILVTTLAAGERETPLEVLMKNETLSAFFSSLDALRGVQRDLLALLAELRSTRQELKDRKTTAESKRLELSALAEDLADQRQLQDQQRRERAQLLAETKNQERRYQQLLAEVERKRDALQQEINSLESGLKPDFDRSALPAPGQGILGWPLPNPIFITQYFGNTSFARSGAYSGKGHNGIDLRAAVGTPIFAAERGVVRAVGDTDLGCRRASYGRWILIDHDNGLATLSAHLSLIKVGAGDGVNRGELIGYSGKTGYATGPHLHLSVFARQAVSVGQLVSRVCGRTMTLPLSPFGGYLNPLDFF